jgi:hypothetical protein
MSDQHAVKYYSGSGSETSANSGPISTYIDVEAVPEALVTEPMFSTPQPGLSAPIAQDQRRGSS